MATSGQRLTMTWLGGSKLGCLEFRRALATDPAQIEGPMFLHAEACAACANALRQALAAQESLREAFALEIPSGLAEKLRQIPATSPGALGRLLSSIGTTGLAAAAMLLACVLAGGTYWALHPPAASAGPALDSAIVKHIREEFWTLTATGKINDEELRGTLTNVGLALREPVDKVRFATNCIIRGKTAAHWVLEGERAPITVLMMPREALSGPATIASSSLRGLLLPVRGGSIALVGAKGEELEKLRRRIMRAVNWNA